MCSWCTRKKRACVLGVPVKFAHRSKPPFYRREKKLFPHYNAWSTSKLLLYLNAVIRCTNGGLKFLSKIHKAKPKFPIFKQAFFRDLHVLIRNFMIFPSNLQCLIRHFPTLNCTLIMSDRFLVFGDFAFQENVTFFRSKVKVIKIDFFNLNSNLKMNMSKFFIFFISILQSTKN